MNTLRGLRSLRFAVLLFALAPQTIADTFVIDDNGGPGVDFTAIQPAIDAASPGDVLLVRPGSYGWITLTKGLSILGEPNVFFGGGVVHDIPANEIAVLSDLRPSGSPPLLRVQTCLGTVIVQRVSAHFTVISSSDVRMLDVTGQGFPFGEVNFPAVFDDVGLASWRSRVEAVQSVFTGASYGFSEDWQIPGAAGVFVGGPGLDAGSLVHLALTSSYGGMGSKGLGPPSGRGGPAAVVGAGAPYDQVGCELVIAGGNAATMQGGNVWGPYFGEPILGGSALVAHDPRIRYSGVELLPGVGFDAVTPTIQTDDPSYVVTPGFADPTLGVSGNATPGSVVVFQIRAAYRSKAFLSFGRDPIVKPDGLAQIPQLVELIRGRKLGAIPFSGQLDCGWPIPANAAVGTLLVFQATVQLPNGEYRRTNSVPVIVR